MLHGEQFLVTVNKTIYIILDNYLHTNNSWSIRKKKHYQINVIKCEGKIVGYLGRPFDAAAPVTLVAISARTTTHKINQYQINYHQNSTTQMWKKCKMFVCGFHCWSFITQICITKRLLIIIYFIYSLVFTKLFNPNYYSLVQMLLYCLISFDYQYNFSIPYKWRIKFSILYKTSSKF